MRKSNYDKSPSTTVDGALWKGWESVLDKLKDVCNVPEELARKVVVIECYHGVYPEELAEHLATLHPSLMIHSDQCFKGVEDIEKMTRPYLTDDRLFGRRAPFYYADFLDADKVKECREKIKAATGLVIVYGHAAAEVVPEADVLVYVDMARWEIQQRFRQGKIDGLGVKNREEAPSLHYKRGYFIDWNVCDALKKQLLPKADYWLDTHIPGMPKMITGETLRAGLEKSGRNPCRVVPFFDPAPWGGQWMKNHIQGLNKEVNNLAWSFELMVLENGLMLESDGYRLEVSFDFLMYSDYQNILGECSETFKYDFPIRFDFLDTFDGDNLSIQCHPRPRYIQEHFNMPFTQDETYYILDCKNSPCVYLGFQDNIVPEEFQYTLERSQQKATKVEIERFVQKHQAKKHDFFLIPNGTIHASGKDCVVLEISSAPYIFTFKMYDWIRMGLDGKPRPLNIQHGMNNLYFERKGEKVIQELICHPYIMKENQECTIEHLPTHKEHFYDVYRYTFKDRIQMNTENTCHVCMIVEGDSVCIETEDGMKQRFNYAETFVIPAAARSYTIINENPDKRIMLVKAFVKKEVTLE